MIIILPGNKARSVGNFAGSAKRWLGSKVSSVGRWIGDKGRGAAKSLNDARKFLSNKVCAPIIYIYMCACVLVCACVRVCLCVCHYFGQLTCVFTYLHTNRLRSLHVIIYAQRETQFVFIL